MSGFGRVSGGESVRTSREDHRHNTSVHASIIGIEYHLPESRVTTAELSADFPHGSIDKIDAKTGICERHIAAKDECASDLAYRAALKAFDAGVCTPAEVDFVLMCTQSPDYALPTTACLLQDRLNIPTTAGALDFNLGCSGFVYGLGLAEGLISSGQATCVLLITAETYSKFMSQRDKSVRTIFGDGAAATVVSAHAASSALIGPFVYGTDGSGGSDLIVPASGSRLPGREDTAMEMDDKCGNKRRGNQLYMNGARILEFTLNVVPRAVNALLRKAVISQDDVDLFVFHQANGYALEELRRFIGIPPDKFQITIAHCGNTVSSTIPIALKHAVLEGRLRKGMLVMAVGFGVGYSWGATLIRWQG